MPIARVEAQACRPQFQGQKAASSKLLQSRPMAANANPSTPDWFRVEVDQVTSAVPPGSRHRFAVRRPTARAGSIRNSSDAPMAAGRKTRGRSLSRINIRLASAGLIVKTSHERYQIRRQSNRLLSQKRAKPFTDFLAKRHVVDAADPTDTVVRGISHEASDLFGGKLGNTQRRAVTRRASWIFAPEPEFRKQDESKSGQTCVEQFMAAVRTSSRPALASTGASPASTLGAKTGSATTDTPRTKTSARAERDLIIWGAADFSSRSLHFRGSDRQQP
jgi:hypothetical protein